MEKLEGARDMERREKEKGQKKEEERPKASGTPTKKKKKRFRLGTVALREIRRFLMTMGFLIRKFAFLYDGSGISCKDNVVTCVFGPLPSLPSKQQWRPM